MQAKLDADPNRDLWLTYFETRSEFDRNLLVETYVPLVQKTAERIHRRLPSEVDIEDLVSAGIFGLLGAISAYDPDKDTKFETFAPQRIHGAMLDHLRSMDWAPRTVRQRGAKVQRARAVFVQEHGREPTDEELVRLLAGDEDPADRIIRDAQSVLVRSLDADRSSGSRAGNDGESEFKPMDAVHDERTASPFHASHRRDVQDFLTKGLSRAERLIILLYYYEQMTMREIGATLDLSESRVSQMHSLTIARLRSKLRNRHEELEPVG